MSVLQEPVSDLLFTTADRSAMPDSRATKLRLYSRRGRDYWIVHWQAPWSKFIVAVG